MSKERQIIYYQGNTITGTASVSCSNTFLARIIRDLIRCLMSYYTYILLYLDKIKSGSKLMELVRK